MASDLREDVEGAVERLRRNPRLNDLLWTDVRIIVEAALSGVRSVPSANLHRIDYVADGLPHRVDCIVDGVLQAVAERLLEPARP